MRNVSILIFGLAIVLGIVTVLLTRNYVNSQRSQSVATVESEDPQAMGTLVVSAVPLNFGDEIAVENLREVPWPVDEDLRPDNSFSKISEVMTGNRRVAIRSIGRNEPLVQDKLSGFGYRATLSQVVDRDKRAVAIRLNDVTGVGGFVLPGDKVDVLYTRDDRSQGDQRVAHTKLIVRDVRVLAIDQIADESTQGAVLAKTATLEVTTEQAQKLSLAARIGALDLVLRPMVVDGEPLDERTETIEVSDLKNENLDEITLVKQEAAQARKPKPGATKPAAPIVRAESQMQITRGTETSQSTVRRSAGPTIDAGMTDSGLVGGIPGRVQASPAPLRAYSSAPATP